MMEQLVFYFFAVVLLLSAIMVVTVRNPVHAILFLVLSFFSSSAIWLLLHAEFLAIVLVLIYVGAVMVLFLFVVMMLDVNLVVMRQGFVRYFLFGITVAVLMVVAMELIIGSDYFLLDRFRNLDHIVPDYSNTKELGRVMYTQYLYQFEIAGAILLVAIVAAIALSMHKLKMTKSKHPENQVHVKKQDRLRIIKMQTDRNDA